MQAPDRFVDASIDRSALVAQGPSGQDKEYGRGPRPGKRLIHEIPRTLRPLIHGFHSLSTTPARVVTRSHRGTGDDPRRACYTWPVQVEVLGLPVNYEAVGEGRPVVFLHGGAADHRLMTVAFEPIFEAREGWRRIYPDLPGMGRTPTADWIKGQDDMLAVVEGFVDAVLPGDGRAALVGASYGGLLALGFMHRRAEKLDGLALIAPSIDEDGDPDRLPAHQVFARDDAVVASLTDDERPWLGTSVVQVAETLRFFRAGVMPGRRLADFAFLERLDAGPGLSIDVAGPLPAPFVRPTLILAGRQDNIVGWADAIPLLEGFPRATYAVLDRAGHGVRAEQNVLFRALVEEWLDRIELEPRS